jgi:hypothetical protein
MTRNSIVALVIVASIAGSALVGPVALAGSGDLLVYPVRETVVKLAFDLAHLRSVAMVAYDASQDVSAPLMHVWDPAAKDWVKTDVEAYTAGEALAAKPSRVFVIGDQPRVVSTLVAASSWCDEVVEVPSLRSVEILNILDEPLDLSNREWKWLAKRYELTLDDRNAELRKKSRRYGPDARRPADGSAGNPLMKWYRHRVEKAQPRAPEGEAELPEGEELEPAPEADETVAPEATEATPVGETTPEPAKPEDRIEDKAEDAAAIEAAPEPQPEPEGDEPAEAAEEEAAEEPAPAPAPEMPEDK